MYQNESSHQQKSFNAGFGATAFVGSSSLAQTGGTIKKR